MNVVWAYHTHRTSAKSGPPHKSHAFHGKVTRFHTGTFLPKREDGATDEMSLCRQVQWGVAWSGHASPATSYSVCEDCRKALRSHKARAKAEKDTSKDKRRTAWDHILND